MAEFTNTNLQAHMALEANEAKKRQNKHTISKPHTSAHKPPSVVSE